VSRSVPGHARHLAAELAHRFGRDAELATDLNNAGQRLRRANDQLWRGIHPDGMAAIYGEDPAAVNAAFTHNRSELLDAPDPLHLTHEVHWTIHHAFVDYQAAAERRRALAAEVGELVRELITTLVAAGWCETDARTTSVHEIAHAGEDIQRASD